MKSLHLIFFALFFSLISSALPTCLFSLNYLQYQFHDTYLVLSVWELLGFLAGVYSVLAIGWLGIKKLPFSIYQKAKPIYLLIVVAFFSVYFLLVYNFLTGYVGCFGGSQYMPLCFLFLLLIDILRGKKY